jgi:hypothetical protein
MLAPDDPIFAAIDNIKLRIAEMTANPKPDYTVGNRSVSWSVYYQNLVGQLRTLLEAAQDLDGPYEINQRVYAG